MAEIKDCCANCRFWRPQEEWDREPLKMDDGTYELEDIQAPCGVRPPTEWLRDPDYINVEPPNTNSKMWCQFHERLLIGGSSFRKMECTKPHRMCRLYAREGER
jgi:hypothetical protein